MFRSQHSTNVAVPADTASQTKPAYTVLLFAGRRAGRNRRKLDKFDLQQPSSDQLGRAWCSVRRPCIEPSANEDDMRGGAR